MERHKLILILIIMAVHTHNVYAQKFGIGYNNGISIRSSISEKSKFGINISGNYNKSIKRDTVYEETKTRDIEDSDSIEIVSFNEDGNSNNQFFKLQLDYLHQLMKVHVFELNLVVSPKISLDKYSNTEEHVYDSSTVKNHRETISIGSNLGFEPTVWYKDVVSINLRVGLAISRSIRTINYERIKHTVEGRIDRDTYHSNTLDVALYGNYLSLNGNLGFHYYF